MNVASETGRELGRELGRAFVSQLLRPFTPESKRNSS